MTTPALTRTLSRSPNLSRNGILIPIPSWRFFLEGEAEAICDQMPRHARVSSSLYRREEKEWLEIPKRELKDGQPV